MSAPLAKFLIDSAICTEISNAYYGLAFYKLPASVAYLGQYYTYMDTVHQTIYNKPSNPNDDDRIPTGDLRDTLKNSQRIYQFTNVKRVLDFHLDTVMLKKYRDTAAHFDHTAKSHFIKAKLLLTNNTIENAWLYAGTASVEELIYKEAVDTNIYNADCKKGFTAYYNQKKGTSYTFNQIDSIYYVCTGRYLDVCSGSTKLLCGKNEPVNIEIDNVQPDICADSTSFAIITATEIWRHYKDSIANHFREQYVQKCLNAVNLESFTVTHPVSEYHYTLYYYDLAGNLVKTVPPEGVKPNRNGTWLAEVVTKRNNNEKQVPAHTLATTYRYNSLNQVVTQKSPDGGLSQFWYDRLGRLAVSQNGKQRPAVKYSYTKYDALGRIKEVGEKYQPQTINQTVTRSETQLRKWIELANHTATHKPREITLTVYDVVSNAAGYYASPATDFKQKSYTLRNRVSYTRYFDELTWYYNVVNGDTTFIPQDLSLYAGVEYSYDIHGNVDSMLNIYYINSPFYSHGNNIYKLIAYKYDLISGKVNQVHYQPGKNDEFYHRYAYDAGNRITDVYTTDVKAFINQEGLEEREARYEYYKHGPLARVITGHQQVQGTDYAYTLQGWLKGVNSTNLSPNHDIGRDGKVSGTNQFVAKDAYGFNLNYFTNEYAAIKSGVTPFPGHSGHIGTEYRPLFNGNISSMAVNIGKFNQPQLYNYRYDQLNRIVGMDTYRGLDTSSSGNSWNSITINNDYKERIAYDANGNITKYLRQGYGSALGMDSLNYKYDEGTNRLNHVRDSIPGTNYTVDIDNQATNNYAYDAIGNLVSDVQEGITNITWNVYGKISRIQRAANAQSNAIDIYYQYDPGGNRVGKSVYRYGTTNTFTAYVRDAQGNVMAVYEKTNNSINGGTLNLTEHHVYGSGRLGLIQRSQNVDQVKVTPVNVNLLGSTYTYNFERGKKLFELSNHLGNVLVTISDKKMGHDGGSGNVDYYEADVVTANDYYPGGMQMPNRKYAATSAYRYGFNGKENDNEGKGEGNQQDYGFRIYDPRLGKFLSVDPLSAEYPWNSTYAFAENDVIRSIDIEGAEKNVRTFAYSVSNGETVSKVVSNDYKQPAGTSNVYAMLGGTPTTTEETVAQGFVSANKLPAGGTFSFFVFDPELKKANYARYDYTDVGGKQQSRYFDAGYIDFMYDFYEKEQQQANKILNITNAVLNATASGALLKGELKALSGETQVAKSSTGTQGNAQAATSNTAGTAQTPPTSVSPTNQPANTKISTLKPGPYAKNSIPASGPTKVFTIQERTKVNEIGNLHGCHTCGTKDPGTQSKNWIPDHQTPSALNPTGVPQVLYPHCLNCSRKQGGETTQAKKQ